MKNIIILLFIIASFAGCKKRQSSACQSVCSCISNDSFIPLQELDSADFYPLILGTWYLQQQNNNVKSADCSRQCYCDTHYSFIFLANKRLIMHLPNNQTDTVSYDFQTDEANRYYTYYGIFNIPGNPSQQGQIYYTSNCITLQTIIDSNNIIQYPPTYFLTRN